jgi:hypothetical protein
MASEPTLICAVGDVHGHIDAMYRIVDELERELDRVVDLVLQVGDFGIWPDPQRLDEATRRHGGAGDFPRWLAEHRHAPRPTIFIAGNHEDFGYLLESGPGELLPGLCFLPWAAVTQFKGLRIGGLGGCYSSRSYAMPSLDRKRRRHYCRTEVRELAAAGSLDLLVIHDAPAGRFSDIRSGWERSWTTHAEGLTELIEATRPRLCLHGHLHGRFERNHAGVPITGLTAVPRPGCAVVFEFSDDSVTPLAEWSRESSWRSSTEDSAASGAVLEIVDVRPLVDLLDEWRDAALGERSLDRAARKLAVSTSTP